MTLRVSSNKNDYMILYELLQRKLTPSQPDPVCSAWRFCPTSGSTQYKQHPTKKSKRSHPEIWHCAEKNYIPLKDMVCQFCPESRFKCGATERFASGSIHRIHTPDTLDVITHICREAPFCTNGFVLTLQSCKQSDSRSFICKITLSSHGTQRLDTSWINTCDSSCFSTHPAPESHPTSLSIAGAVTLR